MSYTVQSLVFQNPHDIILGTRRVEAAVCAFGGVVLPRHDRQNIFRTPLTPYEQALPSRYTIRDRQISWDVEEHPPMIRNSEETAAQANNHNPASDICNEKKRSLQEHSRKRPRTDNDSSSDMNTRYRCKLCGQAKHHHHCPSSVQRSMGVMVYPAVNAYTAAEPGRVAPSLTDMNHTDVVW